MLYTLNFTMSYGNYVSIKLEIIKADIPSTDKELKLSLPLYWWECKIVQLFWNMVWQFHKELDINVSYDPVLATPSHLPKRNEVLCPHKNLHVNVHSSFICNSWKPKQPKCPLTSEWVNKLCDIGAVDYHSVIKRKELRLGLIFGETWKKEYILYDSTI